MSLALPQGCVKMPHPCDFVSSPSAFVNYAKDKFTPVVKDIFNAHTDPSIENGIRATVTTVNSYKELFHDIYACANAEPYAYVVCEEPQQSNTPFMDLVLRQKEASESSFSSPKQAHSQKVEISSQTTAPKSAQPKTTSSPSRACH